MFSVTKHNSSNQKPLFVQSVSLLCTVIRQKQAAGWHRVNAAIVSKLYNCNWRAGKSHKMGLSLCKCNYFMSPGKLNRKSHSSLNLTDFQQGSSLFKKQFTMSTNSPTDELFTKVSNSVFWTNQKCLKICHREQEWPSAVCAVQTHQLASASRRKPNCAPRNAYKK